MTDLEQIKQIFERADIEYCEESLDDGFILITVERGYVGFMSIFSFRPDGSLADLAAYE